MKESESLAKNLKRFRRSKELTQKQLADRVGLSQDSISKIELGKYENPGLKYLTLICRELDVAIEELLMENPQTLKIEIVASDKNIGMVKAFIQAFKNLNLVMGGEKK